MKRALEIAERALGPEHLEVASILNTQGECYRAQDIYDKAEFVLRRALEISENTAGPDHKLTASILDSLGVLYARQRRFDEAEPLLKRAVETAEKVAGPEHPMTAELLTHYGHVLASIGRHSETPNLIRRADLIQAKHHIKASRFMTRGLWSARQNPSRLKQRPVRSYRQYDFAEMVSSLEISLSGPCFR